MPRKKNVPKNQTSLSGIEPPTMKGAKKVLPSPLTPLTKKKEGGNAPENLEISFIQPPDETAESIPEQREHFQLPTRFGAVPVDEAPLGWEVVTRRAETKVTKFQHAYPTIRLPFQEVQRVEFGHGGRFLEESRRDRKLAELFPTGANRLFFGDNLHIMRQLPSESIDLIYIDPPFFSGRNYNVIFGDKNEVRSFSDIWEGGMPGYLVWLNARLWEMKRLLKPTGSIYVHLDWHAVHYVKVEMDKIFGANNFLNEIIWRRSTPTGGKVKSKIFPRDYDSILWYKKSAQPTYKNVYLPYADDYVKKFFYHDDGDGRKYMLQTVGDYSKESIDEFRKQGRIYETKNGGLRLKQYLDESKGIIADDIWTDIKNVRQRDTQQMHEKETIGYPTQKPEALLERIIETCTNKGDIVADFFCGGGTTPAVAQRLNRRWIACDQSRIAVSITADRVAKVVEEKIGNLFPVPDFTVEHWGIYEAPKLEGYPIEKFREFVVRAFGGRPEAVSESIHGMRYGVPLYVGSPSRRSRITKEDVARFAKAVYEERRANHGVMLGWNFGQDARQAAEILAARENKRIDFVRLSLVRLEDDEFREHVVTKSADYAPLLSFIQPPEVRINIQRIGALKYQFDVSESVSLNKDGVIANVQWDFDHRDGHFTSTQGYTFLRDKKTGRPLLVVEYEFEEKGEYKIACSVQDDQGGERTVVQTIEVH